MTVKETQATKPLHREQWLAAVYMNSFRPLDPFALSTGLRSKELLLRDSCLTSSRGVAELFLENSRVVRDDRETEYSIRSYFSDEAIVTLSLHSAFDSAGRAQVPLPRSAALRMSLDEAMRRRRSSRNFTGDPIDLNNLASLLRAASGISGAVRLSLSDGSERQYKLRTAPSAGSLYPVDLAIAAQNVPQLAGGLYSYDVLGDRLVAYPLAPNTTVANVLDCFAVEETEIDLSRSAVIILLVGFPWRSMRKYGARGLRFVLHEAGALSQNVHLACAALGLGSVDCASLYDDEAHEVLGLDGVAACPLHTIIIGHAAE
jgi:SagB-type dehydrogenase family enzyme